MPLVTRQTLAELRQAIHEHMLGYIAVGYGPDLIDSGDLQHLIETGVLDAASARELIGHGGTLADAFIAGMATQRLMDAGIRAHDITHDELLEELRRNPLPLSDAGRQSLEWCRHGAAVHCRHLGERLIASVEGTVWAHDENRRDDARHIREATTGAIAGRRGSKWLRGELGARLEAFDQDLDRIATTELQDAFNHGTAEQVAAVHGPRESVVKVPNPNACETCRKLYMGEDGNPRVFTIEELQANGTNIGRGRRDWRPVIGTTHPWCACELRRLPPGFEFRNGVLVVIGSR